MANLVATFLPAQALTSAGDTPLHMAAYHGRKWAVKTLLYLGANPNLRNNEGKLPYQVARQEDVREVLRIAVFTSNAAGIDDTHGPGESLNDSVNGRRVSEVYTTAPRD